MKSTSTEMSLVLGFILLWLIALPAASLCFAAALLWEQTRILIAPDGSIRSGRSLNVDVIEKGSGKRSKQRNQRNADSYQQFSKQCAFVSPI
jgi:hypothetical protein